MTFIQRRVLLATIIGSGVVFLDGSVVNLALPRIAAELHGNFVAMQWVMDGYLLTLSALILLGGSIGDIFGRKQAYLVGVVGFGLTSALCGAAPTLELLIAGRLLQGVFGALMVPGALAIIDTHFERRQRAIAVARWVAWTTAITTVGPLVGGYLIDHGTWRAIFFINPPLLLLCFWLGMASIRESKDSRKRRLDVWGAVVGAGALAGITYGLIEGPRNHWGMTSLSALALGLALGALFILIEKRSADPMLNLDLFASRNFTGVNIVTFAMYGALGGFFFALMIYVQTTLGYTSLQAGLSVLPSALLLLFLSRRIGALADAFGPRLFMTAGPIIAGVGIAMLIPLDKGASYLTAILPGMTLFGLGLAATVAPLTATMLEAVATDEADIASAVNNAVSRVSGLIVIALLGLLGAQHAFQFATILCAGLAIVAGVCGWMIIENQK